jgi:cytidine diphosphoramidate kinase
VVVWLIGLAGAGKTSIGREVWARLKQRQPNVVFVDGDDVRAIMGHDLGHTIEDRRANAGRISRLCAFLDRQGIDVVCAILSMFPETHDWNRRTYSAYFEVFIDVPMAVLAERDQKGLYSAARAGTITNVAGVDLPFTPPANPDLVIANGDAAVTPAQLAVQIIDALDRGSRPA